MDCEEKENRNWKLIESFHEKLSHVLTGIRFKTEITGATIPRMFKHVFDVE